MQQAKNYYPKMLKTLVLFLLCLVFVLLFVLAIYAVILKPSDATIEAKIGVWFLLLFGVPFFGFGVYYFGKMLWWSIAKKPILTLTHEGITDKTTLVNFGIMVPWAEVASANSMGQTISSPRSSVIRPKSKFNYIVLTLKRPLEQRVANNQAKRTLIKMGSQKMGRTSMTINLLLVKATAGQVLQDITTWSGGKVSIGQAEQIEDRANFAAVNQTVASAVQAHTEDEK